MGITSVKTIFAEGLNMGDEAREQSLNDAMAEVSKLFAGKPAKVKNISA